MSTRYSNLPYLRQIEKISLDVWADLSEKQIERILAGNATQEELEELIAKEQDVSSSDKRYDDLVNEMYTDMITDNGNIHLPRYRNRNGRSWQDYELRDAATAARGRLKEYKQKQAEIARLEQAERSQAVGNNIRAQLRKNSVTFQTKPQGDKTESNILNKLIRDVADDTV